MTKTLKPLSILFVCAVLIITGIVTFRQSLLRAGINSFLAGDAEVTRLEGVQIGSRSTRIDELELALDASRQLLIVAGIDVRYSRPGMFSMPVLEEVTIAAARLLRNVESVGQDDASAAAPTAPSDAVPEQQAPYLSLSGLLLQLRDFPLPKLTLTKLDVPQFKQTIALHFQKQADTLALNLASGTLQLNVAFMQPDPASTAQFTISLQAAEEPIAEVQLALEPQAERFRLAGNGTVELSDANTPFAEYLESPLPVSSVALQWELTGNIADDLFDDSASDLQLGILQGSTVVVRPEPETDPGELAFTMRERGELRLTPGAGLSIQGNIPVDLAGTWQQQTLQSAWVLTPTLCELGATVNCTINFDGTAGLAAYTVTGNDPASSMKINTPEFAGSGGITIRSEFIEATFNSGSRVSSAAITGSAYGVASVNMVLDSALAVRSSSAGQQLEISADQLALQLGQLQVGEYRSNAELSLREINVVSAEEITGQMTLHTAGLALTGPQWVPAIGFDADISIDGAMLVFNAPLLLPNAPRDVELQSSGSYDIAAGSGALNLQMPPLTFTGQGNSLSSYLSGWPFAADVMTGTVAVDLDLHLQPDSPVDAAGTRNAAVITANTRIALTDVAGFYEENFFRGLNTTMHVAYDSAATHLPVTTPPSSLTVDELNAGLAITDIAVAYQLDGNARIAHVSSISGALLDGMITATNINYDFSKQRNEMTFMFSTLSLARMMELSEYQGIEAIGKVSGEIPVIISDGKVEVGAGALYAEAPGGSIRYLDAPPAGQGNPAMDLVNQALSNYQFHTLESSVDYGAEGDLLLGMKLRGRNPDMNGGQEINLNLNISDNIPSLLRSLRAGRAIEDFLQEQLQ